jgi:hypothetical protein
MKKVSAYIAIIILTVACATVKKSRKTTSEVTAKDSVIYVEKVHIDTFKIKADSTHIVLTPYSFKDTMWTYIEKTNGRAKVTIQRIRDTVYITGYCDSVIKLLLNTEKTVFTSHSIEQKQTDISTKKTSNKAAKWIVATAAIFLILLLIIVITIKVSIKSIKSF